jgi:hypothetical protein
VSTCDCQSTEGLNVTPDAQTRAPAPPHSLFDFLEAKDAERIKVKGRDARRIPHLGGPAFVTVTGKLVCRHGASRASLCKRQKADSPSARLPACGCVLKALPVCARGLKGLQLGKCQGKAVLIARPGNTEA